ncbi:MAG: hypothetical protein GX879_06010, partial [Bacteroidales bacterium]|nr:hypothetical protein [Bacteroidales bacterium]
MELRNRFNSDSAFHTALNSTAFCENSIFDAIDVEKSNKNWIHRKLLYEHFGIAKGKNYILYIDPLFDFNLAKSFPYNKNIYVNTRAVQVYASFYNKLTISSSIYENQAKFPDFIDDYYNYFGVIPGHERVKPFGSGAYDWANAYASISFKATKFLHFELGNEKNFIGNGYRSMILSDFSPQYFYFKTSAFWKRFFYTNIASRTLNPNYNNISGTRPNWSANDLYPHKMMNINYFGLNINPKIEIGVFEACMMGINSRLNPKLSAWLPAVNELIYSNSDSLNFLWGSNINVNAFKNLNIYAQFAAQINKSFASQ